jgi:hypothetical protein
MWTVVPDIYNVITAPHIQASIFNWTCLRFYWRYVDNSVSVILQSLCHVQHIFSRLRNVNCGPGHTPCIYSSAYWGISIQLKVSALLSEICRQFSEPYTANLVPNKAHNLQFAKCGLWCRSYKMYLQLQIFRIQYSVERFSAVIGDLSTIQCPLYCKHGANTAYNPQITQCELWSRTYTL